MKTAYDILPALLCIRDESPIGASSLCHKLGLSQATVGRLLLQLEKDGLVKKVSNKGRMLTSKGEEYIAESKVNNEKKSVANELIDLSFSDSAEALLEIMAVRKLLEPFAANLAAQNATEKDIEELENLTFAHRYVLARGHAADNEHLQYHLTIARIAGNQILMKTLELLLTQNFTLSSNLSADRLSAQTEEHFRILEAIKRKDGLGAMSAMKQHLDNAEATVKAYCSRS